MQTTRMEVLAGDALEARIRELEDERDTALAQIPYAKLDKGSTHTKVKRVFNIRISNLRKFGVEYRHQLKEVSDKIAATKVERYGHAGFGNYDKAFATKEARYGYKHWNMTKVVDTKRQLYGNGLGNMSKFLESLESVDIATANAKRKQTNISKFGHANGNVVQQTTTKQLRYGSGFGDLQKISKTTLERYGVPWHCLTQKCRLANGKIITKPNVLLHDMLLEHTGANFEYEHDVDCYAFDLRYDNLLIDINPSFTHNSTFAFDFATGRSTVNKPIASTAHFDKCCVAMQHGYRCITVFDWMSFDAVVKLVKSLLTGTEQLQTADCVELDLSIDDPRLYVGAYHKTDFYIGLHWYNMKTHAHVFNNNHDEQTMIDAGFVKVYDCGHVKLTRRV